MGTLQLYLPKPELSTKPPHKSKGHPKKTSRVSFWAFLLSSLMYISIFYFFNLSPSSLFTTTKFWFFISNTLILIIAADFGAFTSTAQHDLDEEHVKNVGNSEGSFISESTCEELDSNSTKSSLGRIGSSFEHQHHQKLDEESITQVGTAYPQEEIKAIVVVHEGESQESRNKSLVNVRASRNMSERMVIPTYLKEPCRIRESRAVLKNEGEKKLELALKPNNESHGSKRNESKCVRSKSITYIDDEKKNQKVVLRRTKTEKHEPIVEENEFSTMSNEELNSRIEEFIRKFNKQVRLQPALSRKSLEVY